MIDAITVTVAMIIAAKRRGSIVHPSIGLHIEDDWARPLSQAPSPALTILTVIQREL